MDVVEVTRPVEAAEPDDAELDEMIISGAVLDSETAAMV